MVQQKDYIHRNMDEYSFHHSLSQLTKVPSTLGATADSVANIGVPDYGTTRVVYADCLGKDVNHLDVIHSDSVSRLKASAEESDLPKPHNIRFPTRGTETKLRVTLCERACPEGSC